MPRQFLYKNQFVFFPKLNLPLFSLVKVVLLLTSPNNKIKSEMTYNTTVTLDKLACTDYMDFGKCQERFGWIFWSKIFFDYLDVKLKVFKKDENKQFRLAENFTMGEAEFNQFIRLKNQLVVAAINNCQRLYQRGKSTPCAGETSSKRHGGASQTYTQSCKTSSSITQKVLRDYAALHVEKTETSYVQ